MSKKLKGALAAVAAVAAIAAPSAVSAHSNFDGDPSGEGIFVTGVDIVGNQLWALADDFQSDGHCVYVNVVFDGLSHTDAYSCGAPDSQMYSQDGSYEFHRCITGHWVCKFIRSGST
jgi:hypothetical protein